MGGEGEFEDGFDGGVNQQDPGFGGDGMEALFGRVNLGDGDPPISDIIEPAPINEPGPSWPPRAPVGIEQDNGAARGNDSAGSTERGRDLRPNDAPTYAPQFELPQGVTVQEAMTPDYGPPAMTPDYGWSSPSPSPSPEATPAMPSVFSSVADSGNAMATPAMPSEPSPLALGTQNPIQAAPESGTGSGPVRRSQQSPSLFAQSNSPMLRGRAGGLMGGGMGAVGRSDKSGPLQPTQMFQKLLELFRQG